jgi:hypothetical protein
LQETAYKLSRELSGSADEPTGEMQLRRKIIDHWSLKSALMGLIQKCYDELTAFEVLRVASCMAMDNLDLSPSNSVAEWLEHTGIELLGHQQPPRQNSSGRPQTPIPGVPTVVDPEADQRLEEEMRDYIRQLDCEQKAELREMSPERQTAVLALALMKTKGEN